MKRESERKKPLRNHQKSLKGDNRYKTKKHKAYIFILKEACNDHRNYALKHSGFAIWNFLVHLLTVLCTFLRKTKAKGE